MWCTFKNLQKFRRPALRKTKKNKWINREINKYTQTKKKNGDNKNSHLIWELASVFHTLVGGVAPQLVRRLHTHAHTQLPQYEPFIRAADGWVGGGSSEAPPTGGMSAATRPTSDALLIRLSGEVE